MQSLLHVILKYDYEYVVFLANIIGI